MTDRFRSQVRDVINRNSLVSLALERGFNVFLPVFDSGVDLILQRESDGDLRKAQLKGRLTIDRKYIGRDIWVAFPLDGEWFLIEHDEMVAVAEQHGFTRTASWIEKGNYSLPRPSKAIVETCAPYRFATLAKVRAEAEAEAASE